MRVISCFFLFMTHYSRIRTVLPNVTGLFSPISCCVGHIFIKLLQRELNPYLRSDSPPYCRYTMEPYIFLFNHPCYLLFFQNIKSRLSFRTSGSLSVNLCILSGYSMAPGEPSGPRHPLDPVLLRHTQISHSAFLAIGIIVS